VAASAYAAGYFLVDVVEVEAGWAGCGAGWDRVREVVAITDADGVFVSGSGVDLGVVEALAAELRLVVHAVDVDPEVGTGAGTGAGAASP
jgi:hypothetical protein